MTDTGYLDCDGRQGPQGYTNTLVRDVEEISLGISLRPLPDNHESGVPKPSANGREAFARYRPMPDSPAEENGYREAGETVIARWKMAICRRNVPPGELATREGKKNLIGAPPNR